MSAYSQVFNTFQTQDVLLTASQPLATFLQQEYINYQQQRGYRVWEHPKILSITTWLYNLWTDNLSGAKAMNAQLLCPLQEQVLWEHIMAAQPGYPFVNLSATAKMALQAWYLSKQWRLDRQQGSFALSKDTQTWRVWADNFMKNCQASDWLDGASLVDVLGQLSIKKHIALPRRICLLGFNTVNPQYQALLDSLVKQGSQLIRVSGQHPDGQPRRLGLPDAGIELETMTRWAYRLWQQGERRIGCVVLSLKKRYSQVLAAFQDAFMDMLDQASSLLPVHISASISLNHYPLVCMALTGLSLSDDNQLEKVSQLLRSPYFGYSEQERSQRALLDRVLRNHYEPWISLTQLISVSKDQHCPQLAQSLQRYRLLNRSAIDQKQYPSQWVEHFVAKLAALNWPGKQTLNYVECQLLNSWSDLFNELAGLDLILGKIDQATALCQLQQLANCVLFQPQTMNEATIQVFDLLETAGMSFDHLWVMGLDDSAWPEAAYPNPFLPYSLQRQLGLPNASSQCVLQVAEQLTTTLAYSAAEVIFSYPLYQAGLALRPSRLILSANPITLPKLGLSRNLSSNTQMASRATWEFFQDDQAPVLMSQEKVSASTSLIKQQAACPFQAFAHFRLKTQSCRLPQPGLSAAERGTLLHRVLERLWCLIGDQASLQRYSSEQQQQIINMAIDQAWQESSIKKQPSPFKQYFIQIEKQRLQPLLQRWLAVEKGRPPFSVVATEQLSHYKLAQLCLQIRVDRIDRLSDTSYLLIDYKSGQGSLADWFGDRMTEPQLPLYCLSQQPAVQGLALAQLCPDKPQLKGISAKNTAICGILAVSKLGQREADWEALLQYWQQCLTKLAQAFQQGQAAVDPKHKVSTCRYCDLQLLCRIQHSNRPLA